MTIEMKDCPMAQSHQPLGDSFNEFGKGQDCKACELCMSFGAGPATLLITSQFLCSPPPLANEPSFISTQLLPRLKPPIA
jgi:hypothetical protein